MADNKTEIKETTQLELRPQVSNNDIIKLDGFTNANDIMAFAEVLIESKLIPAMLSSPEKVVAVIAQGKELGLSAMTSIFNMYYISGKPCLSVHAINALLKSKGIMHQTIHDFAPCNKDLEIVKAEEATNAVTVIEFMRVWNGIVIKERASFSWNDAIAAELDQKDTWKKYKKIQLWNRCFVTGARRFASDVLLGVMEVTEMADVANVKYNLDEDGKAELIK